MFEEDEGFGEISEAAQEDVATQPDTESAEEVAEQEDAQAAEDAGDEPEE